MIVVLDTNVIISALLSPSGLPAKIIQRWEGDEFDSVVSPQLLDELERVLQYPEVVKYLMLPRNTIQIFLRRYGTVAMFTDPQARLEVIVEDPDDNRVLECAVAGSASFIITGDKHLLELQEYQGIVILSPAAFLAFLESDR